MKVKLNKTLGTFLLAGIGLVTTLCSTAHLPEAPYIFDLDKVTASSFNLNIKDQLAAEKISVAKLDLLPSEAGKAHTNISSGISVTGLGETQTPDQAQYWHRVTNSGAYEKLPKIMPNVFERATKGYRVFVAIHETMHAIDARLDLRYNLIEDKFKDNREVALGTGRMATTCVEERIADVGATLYLLSNFSDKAKANEAIQDQLDERDCRPDPNHYTSDVVRIAIKEFNRKPRSGLTVVEAALWARDIVQEHTDVVRKLDEVLDSTAFILSGKYNNEDVLLLGGDLCYVPAKSEKELSAFTKELNKKAFEARKRIYLRSQKMAEAKR